LNPQEEHAEQVRKEMFDQMTERIAMMMNVGNDSFPKNAKLDDIHQRNPIMYERWLKQLEHPFCKDLTFDNFVRDQRDLFTRLEKYHAFIAQVPCLLDSRQRTWTADDFRSDNKNLIEDWTAFCRQYPKHPMNNYDDFVKAKHEQFRRAVRMKYDQFAVSVNIIKHDRIAEYEQDPELDLANPPKEYMDNALIETADADAMDVDIPPPEDPLSEAAKQAELERIEAAKYSWTDEKGRVWREADFDVRNPVLIEMHKAYLEHMSDGMLLGQFVALRRSIYRTIRTKDRADLTERIGVPPVVAHIEKKEIAPKC
jgi:hypothetical protein